ncbi:6-bladed beta-propeller [Belliella sp. R4-6]|uniref:6-bladed beta-propeller n=1 Tax=Belliella alkalica TaxID=1730871 RepID=A0ABS9V7V8_9BACT|nr:6-bladed beta-propeller [Belliella alkalica]MCH7412453.1 6-bladed beta-propeller [Belliella alkalica]
MSKYVTNILIAILVISCNSTEITESMVETKTFVLDPTENNKIPISEVIEEVIFLPLETTNESLIGDIHSIKYFNNKYFIQDRDKVLCFNADGTFLSKLGSFGSGPDQYSSCDQFVIDEINGYLMINNQRTGMELLMYDSTLQFLSKRKYYEHTESILPIDGKGFCFYFGNKFFESHKHYVKTLDNDLNFKDNFIEKSFTIDHSITSPFHGSYSYQNKAYVYPMFENVIYEIDMEGYIPKYRFDFGNYTITEEFLKSIERLSSRDQMFALKESKYVYNIDRVFESDRWIYFQYYSGTEGMHTVLFNKELDKIYDTRGFTHMPDFGMMSLMYGMDGDDIYYTLDPNLLHGTSEEAVNFQKFILSKNEAIRKLKDKTENGDNPILVIGKLKK